MKIKQKHYESLYSGEKLPRKIKKHLLGKRMSKSKLNRLLGIVTLGEPIRTMYEQRDILPFAFCPNCGCKDMRGSGNLSSYPEHWEKFRCLRCSKIVGYIDNSPFIHALECKDKDYDPTF